MKNTFIVLNVFQLQLFNIIFFSKVSKPILNPLPHMPIFGSSNSAANKDIMPKILTNADTIF